MPVCRHFKSFCLPASYCSQVPLCVVFDLQADAFAGSMANSLHHPGVQQWVSGDTTCQIPALCAPCGRRRSGAADAPYVDFERAESLCCGTCECPQGIAHWFTGVACCWLALEKSDPCLLTIPLTTADHFTGMATPPPKAGHRCYTVSM